MSSSRPHVGFVLERALGHVTHADNLKRLLTQQQEIDAEVVDVEWDAAGMAAKVPLFNSNWTVRAGLRARRGIRRMQRERPLDALFVHTQVPAVLSSDLMRHVPTIVSVDATPLQYDDLGAHYDHRSGNKHVERLKWRANRACFDRAAHIVSWSAWAKRGLIDGYGVTEDKVTVIPPGVTPSEWTPRAPRSVRVAAVQILFVGADLERKGGDVLLRSFRQLREGWTALGDPPELHLVTRSEVPVQDGVTVHHGLRPGSPQLVELYQHADIFCLPTRADCLPMVLSEAGAAGLPVISTALAGIPEIVRDGSTGLVVPVDDVAAVAGALRTLVTDPDLRARLGAAARALVERDFNAETNAGRLVELLSQAASDRSGAR